MIDFAQLKNQAYCIVNNNSKVLKGYYANLLHEKKQGENILIAWQTPVSVRA